MCYRFLSHSHYFLVHSELSIWLPILHLFALLQNHQSVVFISQFSNFAGINPYVIAFTALASGTSWPDLVASKIAAERQTTADSAIANITCRSSSQHASHFKTCSHNHIISLKQVLSHISIIHILN